VPCQNTDLLSNQVYKLDVQFGLFPCKTGLMLSPLRLVVALFAGCFRTRRDLVLKNLALRHLLGVFKRKHSQSRFGATDKLFGIMLRRLWAGWRRALILGQPETVVRWHRAGYRLYWTWLSRHRARAGRKYVSRELRELIFQMIVDSRSGEVCVKVDWGAWGRRVRKELKEHMRWPAWLNINGDPGHCG
jgi:hypothetical protein